MVGNKLLCIPGLWKLSLCVYVLTIYTESEEVQVNSVLRERTKLIQMIIR